MAVVDVPLTLPSKNFESDQKEHRANNKQLEESAQSMFLQLVPVGAVLPYAGASAPTGYIACTGQAISRSVYATLFTVIGTNFGAGDGSTTFNVPNFTAASSTTYGIPAGAGTGFALGATATIATAGAVGKAIGVNFIIKS